MPITCFNHVHNMPSACWEHVTPKIPSPDNITPAFFSKFSIWEWHFVSRFVTCDQHALNTYFWKSEERSEALLPFQRISSTCQSYVVSTSITCYQQHNVNISLPKSHHSSKSVSLFRSRSSTWQWNVVSMFIPFYQYSVNLLIQKSRHPWKNVSIYWACPQHIYYNSWACSWYPIRIQTTCHS